MSIYNPSNFNNDSEYVELPYLKRVYSSKSLLSATTAPINTTLLDHEGRITALETVDTSEILDRLDAVESKDTEQDGRLDGLDTSIGTKWTNGGDSFGADSSIGTNDAHKVLIKQNGTNKISVEDSIINMFSPAFVSGN